jgi:hypothetical protein
MSTLSIHPEEEGTDNFSPQQIHWLSILMESAA